MSGEYRFTAPCPACAAGIVLEDVPCSLCQGAHAVPLADVTRWHFEQARKANERVGSE